MNPEDPLVSISLELKYTSRILYPAFTTGSGIKLRTHAYSASPLPAEPSPQPGINFQKVKWPLMIDFKTSPEKKKKKPPQKIHLHGRYFKNYFLKDRLNTDYHIHFKC